MDALTGTRHVECDGGFNIRDLGVYRCDKAEVVHLPVLEEVGSVDLADGAAGSVSLLVDRCGQR